jgi:hypothetical protein
VRRQTVLLALAYLLTGLAAFAQPPDPAPSGPQTNPTPATCTANCPQAPAKPAVANPEAAAKPPAKPHKVITNEDFDARGHEITIEGGRELLEKLNTCDRTCFNEVAQRASISGGYSARWKLVLLDAVDTVKADSAWQGILGQILGVQSNACELQTKKTQDLQRFSDPRTVTPSELTIEREYEPKFREIKSRLNAALDRANAHIAKNSDSVLQSAYMHRQVDKVVHATCTITIPQPPEDTDDPDDP